MRKLYGSYTVYTHEPYDVLMTCKLASLLGSHVRLFLMHLCEVVQERTARKSCPVKPSNSRTPRSTRLGRSLCSVT